jgi:hypothetical protein
MTVSETLQFSWPGNQADQFSNLSGTDILPVAEKHGQDARAA